MSAFTREIEDFETLIDVIKISAMEFHLNLDQIDFLVRPRKGSIINQLVYEIYLIALSGIRSVEAKNNR